MAFSNIDAAEYRKPGVWEGRTVTSFLNAAVAATPEALAVVDGRVRLDYRELAAASGRLAAALSRHGVRRAAVVSYQLPNWHETAVIHHAVTAGALVNNPIIPIYRHHELGFILSQAKPDVIFIPQKFRGFDYVSMLDELITDQKLSLLPVVVRSDGHLPPGFKTFEEFADLASGDFELPDLSEPTSPTLLLYTSGTTASPKGVLHSHESLVYENRSMISWLGLNSTDVVFMASPVTHITGVLYGMQLPPMLGSPVVYQDVWNAVGAASLIEEHAATFTVAATPFLAGIVAEYETRRAASSLRIFACGGADVPPQLITTARDRLDCAVVRVYGSTEFPTFCASTPDDPPAKAANTDGRPIGPVAHRIVDEEGSSLEAGLVGELLVRGPECFQGYLDSTLNAESFSADGYFKTGDLASEDRDGFITIHGRKKDIIIRNGENISAKEVEDLLFQHPSVREVAVVAMPDPLVGERACAYVALNDGCQFSEIEMKAHLDGCRVARQKYPERLELMPGGLPKTASGKIQKFKLRDDIRQKLESERSGRTGSGPTTTAAGRTRSKSSVSAAK
jgi:cyclohexanecarboxylate-CoA ligase